MKIPTQLLGSWAGPAAGQGAAVSPARVLGQLGTRGHSHASPGSTRARRRSHASQVLRHRHHHSHIRIFSSSCAEAVPPRRCPRGPPQPTQIRHGDAVSRARLFMESKAEPDAENLHFMGNFSIYFILALEKPLKPSQ